MSTDARDFYRVYLNIVQALWVAYIHETLARAFRRAVCLRGRFRRSSKQWDKINNNMIVLKCSR